jgi:transcriptional regulator with XRE-family HTH domain
MDDTLATALRALRARRGVTLAEAAKEIGIRRESLGHIERGVQKPHTATLGKIANYYSVDVEELLEEESLAGKAEGSGEEAEPEQQEIRGAGNIESAEQFGKPHIYRKVEELSDRLVAREINIEQFKEGVFEAIEEGIEISRSAS